MKLDEYPLPTIKPGLYKAFISMRKQLNGEYEGWLRDVSQYLIEHDPVLHDHIIFLSEAGSREPRTDIYNACVELVGLLFEQHKAAEFEQDMYGLIPYEGPERR